VRMMWKIVLGVFDLKYKSVINVAVPFQLFLLYTISTSFDKSSCILLMNLVE
jgi:hypothetical protein